MSRFLDPPKAGKPLAEDKVDKTYKAMRTKVFLGAFFGYAAYYLVRKNLSLAAPDMIHDGIIDAGKAGLAMSAVSIAYAFSNSSWAVSPTGLTPGSSSASALSFRLSL